MMDRTVEQKSVFSYTALSRAAEFYTCSPNMTDSSQMTSTLISLMPLVCKILSVFQDKNVIGNGLLQVCLFFPLKKNPTLDAIVQKGVMDKNVA